MASNRSGVVSVVVPCYLLPHKAGELLRFTREAFDSLRQWTRRNPMELVVVDNGSQFGVEYLEDNADVYIRNRTNLGFAPAVNQGLKAATGEWLVVMNNDVTLIHDWAATAIDQWDDRTGIISSHLHEHDPEHRVIKEIAPWGHFFGALWMTRREVLDDVGYLDEGFERGMFEDRDLVLRIVKAGYQHIKTGWCFHVGNATWGKLPNQHQIYVANKERFEAKWGMS